MSVAEKVLTAEKALMQHLPGAAVSPEDRQIIEAGLAKGMVPSHHDYKVGDYHEGIRWYRFRAACARAEAQINPALSAYLLHRACDSDREADDRERFLAREGLA